MQPVVAVYVAGVFVGFIALAYFVFRSPDAVKALATTCVGSLAALAATMLTRSEYRLTEVGLGKRLLSPKKPREFKDVFAWDDLSHLVPTRTGFKYYKKLDEPRRLARVFKLHVFGDYSGEFHVEREDRERVRALIAGRGVQVRLPSRSGAP